MYFNKFLLIILLFLLIGIYYTAKPLRTNNEATNDAAVCAGLPEDPSTLSFISYSTQEGFDACVSRCMTSVMRQVCRQLPEKSNIFSKRPEVKQQMLADCIQNIKHFVDHNTRCPYLNCEP
jgi:hypothetical protein